MRTLTTFINFDVLYRFVRGAPKQSTIVTPDIVITDHRDKSNTKKSAILPRQNVTQRREVSKSVGKTAPIDLLATGLSQTFSL